MTQSTADKPGFSEGLSAVTILCTMGKGRKFLTGDAHCTQPTVRARVTRFDARCIPDEDQARTEGT